MAQSLCLLAVVELSDEVMGGRSCVPVLESEMGVSGGILFRHFTLSLHGVVV